MDAASTKTPQPAFTLRGITVEGRQLIDATPGSSFIECDLRPAVVETRRWQRLNIVRSKLTTSQVARFPDNLCVLESAPPPKRVLGDITGFQGVVVIDPALYVGHHRVPLNVAAGSSAIFADGEGVVRCITLDDGRIATFVNYRLGGAAKLAAVLERDGLTSLGCFLGRERALALAAWVGPAGSA